MAFLQGLQSFEKILLNAGSFIREVSVVANTLIAILQVTNPTADLASLPTSARDEIAHIDAWMRRAVAAYLGGAGSLPALPTTTGELNSWVMGSIATMRQIADVYASQIGSPLANVLLSSVPGFGADKMDGFAIDYAKLNTAAGAHPAVAAQVESLTQVLSTYSAYLDGKKYRNMADVKSLVPVASGPMVVTRLRRKMVKRALEGLRDLAPGSVILGRDADFTPREWMWDRDRSDVTSASSLSAAWDTGTATASGMITGNGVIATSGSTSSDVWFSLSQTTTKITCRTLQYAHVAPAVSSDNYPFMIAVLINGSPSAGSMPKSDVWSWAIPIRVRFTLRPSVFAAVNGETVRITIFYVRGSTLFATKYVTYTNTSASAWVDYESLIELVDETRITMDNSSEYRVAFAISTTNGTTSGSNLEMGLMCSVTAGAPVAAFAHFTVPTPSMITYRPQGASDWPTITSDTTYASLFGKLDANQMDDPIANVLAMWIHRCQLYGPDVNTAIVSMYEYVVSQGLDVPFTEKYRALSGNALFEFTQFVPVEFWPVQEGKGGAQGPFHSRTATQVRAMLTALWQDMRAWSIALETAGGADYIDRLMKTLP
jgi:hypothetical protein